MQDALLPFSLAAIGAFVVWLQGFLGARGALRRNAVFGIRTSATTASNEAWFAAHKAAARHSYGSALAFLLSGVASAAFGTTDKSRGLIILGGITIGMLIMGLGVRVANASARSV